MLSPETKTMTHTLAASKAKIIKQEPQQQTTPKDIERTEEHEELKDKPNDLKRYEETLKQATFYYIRGEVQCSKGKHSSVKTPSNKMCQVLS